MVPAKEESVVLNGEEYTFFKVTSNSNLYVMLVFNLCHKESSGSLLEMIQVWDENGELGVLNDSNALSGGKNWTITEGCIKLNTPFMIFDNQPNGER